MTKSNLTRNCTSFVSCFITYKFQPNIVKYSNVGLLIRWLQFYQSIKRVSIWDKNHFWTTFQEQPKYGLFQEQFQNQKKIEEQYKEFREFKNERPPCSTQYQRDENLIQDFVESSYTVKISIAQWRVQPCTMFG